MAILFFFMVLVAVSVAQPLQPPVGCPTHCRDVEVPYPFGIGRNCSRHKFHLQCKKNSDGNYKPHISKVEVHGILVSQGQARVQTFVSSLCYNNSTKDIEVYQYNIDMTNRAFWVSNTQNRFVVVCSETSAYVKVTSNKSIWYTTGCTSVSLSEQGLVNGSCSGAGCCQASIPFGMKNYNITFDRNFNNSDTLSFSPCGYAMLMGTEGFQFSTSYLTSPGSFMKEAKKS